MERRRFLQGVAATSALGLLRPGAAGAAPLISDGVAALPDPATAPFDHVIVLMFENRSYDHFLGWLPGGDGVQQGLTFKDQTGTTYPTYDLGEDPQGCDYKDPDHSWEGFVIQHNGGKNDGFLRAPAKGRGVEDTFPAGYYAPGQIPAVASIAQSYTVLDRYFASFAGETFPNRFYQHAARTDRDHNMGVARSTLGPTIWDRLAAKGLSAGYYFVDEPFLALFATSDSDPAPRYLPIMKPWDQLLVDLAPGGTLPNVSFVDPSFVNEDQGQSGDFHPHGDIRAGEAFLSTIYHAVRNSLKWDKTVLVINFDEWGGFYDHVNPPKVVDDTVRAALTPPGDPVPDYTQLGFRVPCMVVSPFSAAKVHHPGPYEHSSVLKMIEWRWGLAPLTARDANARNLAEVLDFNLLRTDEPNVPDLDYKDIVSVACGPTSVKKSVPAAVVDDDNTSGTTTTTVGGGGSSDSGSDTGAGGLAATGVHVPMIAATAALTGGMAILAAERRARLAGPDPVIDPMDVWLGLADPVDPPTPEAPSDESESSS